MSKKFVVEFENDIDNGNHVSIFKHRYSPGQPITTLDGSEGFVEWVECRTKRNNEESLYYFVRIPDTATVLLLREEEIRPIETNEPTKDDIVSYLESGELVGDVSDIVYSINNNKRFGYERADNKKLVCFSSSDFWFEQYPTSIDKLMLFLAGRRQS